MGIPRDNPAQTPATRNGVNRYTFLERENQPETGYMDLQARFYDPTIGRFFSVDPETEGQLEFSPYHYSFNNPILFSDPDGRFPGSGSGGALLSAARSEWNAFKRDVNNLVNRAERATATVLSYTDVNDAAVLVTSVTRGSNAINIDGSPATAYDKGAAVAGAILPVVSGSAVKKVGDAIAEIPAVKEMIKKLEIVISPENKINRDLINPPNKPGNAPTFKEDGTPVEIHHVGQSREGPFVEMSRTDHRGVGNDKINHPNKGQKSEIDRKEFNRARQEYWKREYPQ